MLNLYSVKTRAVARDRWDGVKGKTLLDTTYRHLIVASAFEGAVSRGLELATKQFADFFQQFNEDTVDVTTFDSAATQSLVTPRYPKRPDFEITTIECKVEATGVQLDHTVLSAQVNG